MEFFTAILIHVLCLLMKNQTKEMNPSNLTFNEGLSHWFMVLYVLEPLKFISLFRFTYLFIAFGLFASCELVIKYLPYPLDDFVQ